MHVQLAYLLKALQLWRKTEHKKCLCTCKCCRDQHRLCRDQFANCSQFGAAIHHHQFCEKDNERHCRPLRCALGTCEYCKHYDDALTICPKEYNSKRMVRYKTIEPVSAGGKVFDDWIYRELAFRPFMSLLRDYYLSKYRYCPYFTNINYNTHTLTLFVTFDMCFRRLHNWIYKWQDMVRRRVIKNLRPHQLVICLDYANRYTHWQQDGATCKHDRQSSHLVVFVLSNPVFATSAKIDKVSHTCEAWTFWNEDPKQTPECIHAALRHIIRFEKKKAVTRGQPLKEVIVFSDRCGEQNSGRKNFRMCSETAMLLHVILLWIFACPHHFAGVWDAWGGSEAKLLKNVENRGHDTMRTVVDCVVKLRQLRKKLLVHANGNKETRCNDVGDCERVTQCNDVDVSDADDESNTDSECSCVEQSSEDEGGVTEVRNNTYKADGAHIHLLKLCKCRSAAVCTCVPDPRVKDTIYYRRDPKYEAAVIKGCASMFAYRFLPKRKYVVHIRQFACETCPGCVATRSDDVRYTGCVNLSTVRATSYKCAGHKTALRSNLTRTTGWVEHKIVPLVTTSAAGTRATDGLTRVDHRARLQYVGGLRPGDFVFVANIEDTNGAEFRPRNFWIAQLLPPPNSSTIVWKTRRALPPDCPAGSYCCKIQWFKRVKQDGRLFVLASAQYISLSCIVPVGYKIVVARKTDSLYELSEDLQSKILGTLGRLVIDD